MRNDVVETILFNSFGPHRTRSNLSLTLPLIWMKQFHGSMIWKLNLSRGRLDTSTSCLRVSRNHDSKKSMSGSNPPAKNLVFNSANDTTSHGMATPEGHRFCFFQNILDRLRGSVPTWTESKHSCSSNAYNQNACKKERAQRRCRSMR